MCGTDEYGSEWKHLIVTLSLQVIMRPFFPTSPFVARDQERIMERVNQNCCMHATLCDMACTRNETTAEAAI